MDNKTSIATIIGATGLIGSHILKQLCADSTFSEIRVVVRRPFEYPDAKVKIVLLKFTDADALRDAITGSDVVFCAIGTTRSQTPDLQEYRKVDQDIPVNTALISAATGVRSFQLVSSIGANAESSNFYLQIKGEVELAVAELQIPSINIFRPSLLLGERSKPRLAERIAAVLMKPFYFLIPDKQKPIEAICVARAMIQAAKVQKPGVNVYHYTEMMQSL
ncbi:MAG: NAD(P)H-binding protein [Paludibacter sp.]|nr:NAD(P)H-binding protein [Paludibacter sp.]